MEPIKTNINGIFKKYFPYLVGVFGASMLGLGFLLTSIAVGREPTIPDLRDAIVNRNEEIQEQIGKLEAEKDINSILIQAYDMIIEADSIIQSLKKNSNSQIESEKLEQSSSEEVLDLEN